MCVSAPVLNPARGPDGRFKSHLLRSYEPLISTVKEALVGELLGDGCLRYTAKVINGKRNPNCNVIFAMTLKSYEQDRKSVV